MLLQLIETTTHSMHIYHFLHTTILFHLDSGLASPASINFCLPSNHNSPPMPCSIHWRISINQSIKFLPSAKGQNYHMQFSCNVFNLHSSFCMNELFLLKIWILFFSATKLCISSNAALWRRAKLLHSPTHTST